MRAVGYVHAEGGDDPNGQRRDPTSHMLCDAASCGWRDSGHNPGIYVMGYHRDWDVLLGRPWMRGMKAIENYDKETLTITGVKGHSQTICILPHPNLFEPEDAGLGCYGRLPNHKRKQERLRHKPTRPFYDTMDDADEEMIRVQDDQKILEEVEMIVDGDGRLDHRGRKRDVEKLMAIDGTAGCQTWRAQDNRQEDVKDERVQTTLFYPLLDD
ncbi:hypothetical protein BGZ61DRAFT_484908 [Ilyonectria robusta]|uniref:uncharacterized protein n=1 Tax=Ilyonectria robusta TaxID=1079257 RepID=UPI001E8DB346|nr:uncharacterized protein BGZ61DRAFT_484908 [Ilyonectria robusta]KAH8663853.1 hypothetical protein BGZ61DRAFT_484908 [Ilyonectria robusta]